MLQKTYLDFRRFPGKLFLAFGILALSRIPTPTTACAEDWPQWRGEGRLGVWDEDGIVEKFPEKGLSYAWRQPIGEGFSGPAVAEGRVFVTDFVAEQGRAGSERLLCLDETTGRELWKVVWDVKYEGLSYASGPRATPTVDGDRVYALGAMGDLFCVRIETAKPLWRKNYLRDFKADLPMWGMNAAPLVDGDRLICLVGGQPDAKVVALNKMTGEELWRAIDSTEEPGYVAPIVIEAGGVRQLIVWHPRAVTSLNPETGEFYWEKPFKVRSGLTIPTPIFDGRRLLVTSFYNGSMMLELDANEPGARVLWKSEIENEIKTQDLHSLIPTPVFKGDYFYGIGSYGQLRCIESATGRRVWESLEATGEKARWSTAFIVRNGDRYFLNNDRGDLIIADLSPEGYREISRTHLIDPTMSQGIGRRELGAVNWSHPAYANRHIIARNDGEIVRARLAKE